MNNIKEKEAELNLMYFKLDVKFNIMYDITGKSKINDCDMAIIRTSSFNGNYNIQQIIEQSEKYLNDNFPNGDWYYRISNRGKHVFWKRQSLLRQRQSQMQIPFNQAA